MNPQDHTFPDFHGKVVTFYSANVDPECAVTLVTPSFNEQAGRLFVVGKVVPHQPPNWADGLKSAVAWDQVNSYVVFDSLDEYQARVSSYYDINRTNGSKWWSAFQQS